MCSEPVGHIIDSSQPSSLKTVLSSPARGTIGLVGVRELAHFIGEQVHRGRIIEDTGFIIGEPGTSGLNTTGLLVPAEQHRYNGISKKQFPAIC